VISIVGQDITEIPQDLGTQYTGIKELSVSFCRLTKVTNLDNFNGLVSLVLDNNEISSDHNVFPFLPNLETLWVNNNSISYLDRFLASIKDKTPKLSYLSMLKNPCCPNYFVGRGSKDYKKYRAEVLKEIPTLKFLDSSPITEEERDDAKKLLEATRRPDASQYNKANLDGFSIPEAKALPRDMPVTDDKAKLSHTTYTYSGRQSEGNRFINNNNL